MCFCRKFLVVKYSSSCLRYFEHTRIRQGKTDDTILRINSDFSPKIFLVDRHKCGLTLLAQQARNGLIFDHRMRPEIRNVDNFATIPLGDFSFKLTASQLLIQHDHQAAFKSGRVFRNWDVTTRIASIIASLGIRPQYPATIWSRLSPTASRSSVPVISIRVSLKVGRPPHTSGARTTYFPNG